VVAPLVSSGAEIDLLHLRITSQIGRRARQHASADLQHGREIRNLQRQLDRLLGEQDRQPCLCNRPKVSSMKTMCSWSDAILIS
jgi:hypothetical protein